MNYRVSDLTVDTGRQVVSRAGDTIALPKLSYDLFLVLLRAAPNLVSLDELMRLVWPGIVVSPETWPSDVAKVCSTPKGAAIFGTNATPLTLSPSERTRAQQAFDEFGQAIAAYEIGSTVSPFTSKFDAYLANSAVTHLTAQERRGYELFRGKAQCNTCHLDGRSNTATGSDTGLATNVAPMFTDFTYNNLGLPRNVILPWYSENTPDQWGFTGNPLGIGFTDEGVGLFLDGYYGAPPNLMWGQYLPFFEGKFQTSTVRNVGQGALRRFRQGVHAQWLFAQPQGSRPLLQHPRCLSSTRALRPLSRGDRGESHLLAHAGRPEQREHDHRQTRSDGG